MDLVLSSSGAAFNLMAKPAGASCNLRCEYCYYLEKDKLYAHGEAGLMSAEVLESFIRKYIQAQQVPVISFVWQGGEPSLASLDFYRTALALQRKYAGSKQILNFLQTNATRLNDAWCEFLAANNFLVGISIDGPAVVHDLYRKDATGKPTHSLVMKAIQLMKKHGVEFNTLTTVNSESVKYPLEIYQFLKHSGSGFIQFLPVVERRLKDAKPGEPGLVDQYPVNAELTSWSVAPVDYGKFLCAIYDEWIRNDVGRVFVQLFDVTLANWIGQNPGLCVFSESCGEALAIEKNGDLYSCDHFVYPSYKLGNILADDLQALVYSKTQRSFGLLKREQLAVNCLECEYRFACHGDCPKHRFVPSGEENKGISYLCESYKMFFAHAHPGMQYMAEQLEKKQAPANVMGWLKHMERPRQHAKFSIPGRNDRCPCGSGQKYKNCCGKEPEPLFRV